MCWKERRFKTLFYKYKVYVNLPAEKAPALNYEVRE